MRRFFGLALTAGGSSFLAVIYTLLHLSWGVPERAAEAKKTEAITVISDPAPSNPDRARSERASLERNR